MKVPGRRSSDQHGAPAVAATDPDQPTRINLGDHSAGSAAATIRRLGELLGYVVVASGPASFRLTRPVRRGIRRVDQAVNVALSNERDGLWVSHDGPVDPRLIEQLEAEARVAEAEEAPSPAPPVANLPRPDNNAIPTIPVRPGAAPKGLIDSVPGASTARPLPPPRVEPARGLVVRLPDGRSVSGDSGLVIGRDPSTSLQRQCQTPVAVDDPGVSKTHVAVWVDEGAIVIEDLHSTNGSEWAVNGETNRCEAGRPVAVHADRLSLLIGSATIVLERLQ